MRSNELALLGAILAAHPHLHDHRPGGLFPWLLPTALAWPQLALHALGLDLLWWPRVLPELARPIGHQEDLWLKHLKEL